MNCAILEEKNESSQSQEKANPSLDNNGSKKRSSGIKSLHHSCNSEELRDLVESNNTIKEEDELLENWKL